MAREWTTFQGIDLHLELDPAGGRRRALEQALRQAIGSGRLGPAARVPSSRALAADLGLARGTVTEAYDQLIAEGWLVARRGSGTQVAAVSPELRRHPLAVDDHEPRPPRHDFRPGRPDVSSFPRREWVAALRRALQQAPDDAFGYGDPRGRVELRASLSRYLARARGVRIEPGELVVCNGWVQAIALLVPTLGELGVTALATEDPSMPEDRAIAAAHGLDLVDVPVDSDGADPGPLTALAGVGAVLLTPAHQYPSGVTLSAERRGAWLAWARESGALLIEDDYDGEFRYDRQPVGALQGLDPERVVYAGTASKSLAPGLRLAWMALPRRVLDPLVEARRLVDRQSGVLDQLALAELIDSGALDRHVRRVRGRYRRRRDVLLRMLAADVPAVRARGIAAGLHTLVDLPADGPAEDEVVAALGERGVAVQAAGEYRRHVAAGTPGAIVVGFGTPAEHAFAASALALVDGLAAVVGPSSRPRSPAASHVARASP